ALRAFLASAALAAGPRSPGAFQEGSAPRPRPLFTRVLSVGERARTSADAMAELRGLTDELEAEAWGLTDPPDSERVLASTIALCILAGQGRGEDLHEVLVEVEANLRSDARDDPDLALALAHGWHALLLVPFGKKLPLEERVAGLTFALEAAHAIDSADHRDG